MSHESLGKSDDWFTPAYIFEALGCVFDLDVAHPADLKTHVPAKQFISANSLEWDSWFGFIWMNPPLFGARNGLEPWLAKFFAHGNGIALTPDRTSAPWWQAAARKADAVLFVSGKVKFQRPDGSIGNSPSNGTTLLAVGQLGTEALRRAEKAGLGIMKIRDYDLDQILTDPENQPSQYGTVPTEWWEREKRRVEIYKEAHRQIRAWLAFLRRSGAA